MKKILTLLFSLFLLGCATAHAQTKKVDELDTTINLRVKYSVLKANHSIKEGPYSAYTPYENRLMTEGFYKDNQKDSIWKQYIFKTLIEAGRYKNGQKVGLWNAYNSKGVLTLQYDFTNLKLLLYDTATNDTTKTFYVIAGADTVQKLLERQPIYLDGSEMAMRTLLMTLRYPLQAALNGKKGKVLVGFTIGVDGKTSGYHIVRSLGSGCDEAAMRSVKKIYGDWLPGVLDGKPVAVEIHYSNKFFCPGALKHNNDKTIF